MYSKVKYKINLKAAHEASGLSVYRVVKDTKIAPHTVNLYATQIVIMPNMTNAVATLAQYYGVDLKTAFELVESVN
jgi:hypothetical protein